MVICLFGSLEYSPESKFIEEEIKLSDIKLPNWSSVNPLFLALLYSSEANLNKFLVNKLREDFNLRKTIVRLILRKAENPYDKRKK